MIMLIMQILAKATTTTMVIIETMIKGVMVLNSISTMVASSLISKSIKISSIPVETQTISQTTIIIQQCRSHTLWTIVNCKP